MFRTILLVCITACIVTTAAAQERPPIEVARVVDFSKVEISITRHSANFFTMAGHGGTISVLTGPDGILLVDSQFAPLTNKIVAALGKISDQPVRYLLNTHVHADHTGGNTNFAQLGAQIFSRNELRQRLTNPPPGPDGRSPPPAPAKALPVITYDGPVTLHINGEDVQLIPIRAAHTDGDTLIRFPKQDVLAVGDFYRSVGYPFSDIFNGGTLDGLLAGLDQTIALAGPATRIVPGHGPIVDRQAMVAQRDLILAIRDRMRPLIAQGLTLEQVLAARVTADTENSVSPLTQTAEQFVRWMYADLKRSR